MKNVLGIDPGPVQSGYVITTDYVPVESGKIYNSEILEIVKAGMYTDIVVEMLSCYGKAIGAETLETAIWIGRLIEATETSPTLIYRRSVKMNLTGSNATKDHDVIEALKERFGQKGTKKAPGTLYGLKADAWQAYALVVTYLDNPPELAVFDYGHT